MTTKVKGYFSSRLGILIFTQFDKFLNFVGNFFAKSSMTIIPIVVELGLFI